MVQADGDETPDTVMLPIVAVFIPVVLFVIVEVIVCALVFAAEMAKIRADEIEIINSNTKIAVVKTPNLVFLRTKVPDKRCYQYRKVSVNDLFHLQF